MAEEKPSATHLHGSFSAPHDAIAAGSESGEMWMGVAEPDGPARRLPMDAEIEADALFYGAFPSLADFPFISQSSSSSLSASGAVSTASCSSSSSSERAPSWLKADPDENSCEKPRPTAAKGVQMAEPPPPPLPPHPQVSLPAMQEEEADGMDVLEDLSDMELLDSSGMWDPSSLFTAGDEDEKLPQQQLAQLPLEEEDEEGEGKRRPSDDLAMVFLEWLKSNKEAISPEELRSIRLKRSTIECAAKRLGGGKEGMKQLLKLILAWVQNHHLQKRKNTSIVNCSRDGDYGQQQQPMPLQVQFPAGNTWVNPHSSGGYHPDPMLPPPPAQFHPQMMVGFAAVGGEGGYGGTCSSAMMPPPSGCGEYPIMDGTLGWGVNFGGGYGVSDGPQFVGYGGKFGGFAGQHGVLGEPLMRMAPSATKEARKKRMARQRRIFSHHHHHHHRHHQHSSTSTSSNNNQNHQNQQQQHHYSANGATVENQSARLANDGNCTTANATGGRSPGNWVMWPSSSAAASTSPSQTTMLSPLDGDPQPSQQRQMGLDRRQGWKPEKNLRFLLQKVLKQSDVGNLGRIVLPKKEAETHLPELEARDGISIAMEDIGTSRIWNMRYRYATTRATALALVWGRVGRGTRPLHPTDI
ncbi:B3 domain-containing transcription factor [Asimina triloba]